ncbi:MAG: HIT domain-containing protein [Sulfolobaceae archaeon]
MNILWAPWRLKYILSSASKRMEECLFCRVLKENDDRKNYIVYRGKLSYIILNAFPYNPGHVMVVPYRHVPTLELLDDNEGLELFQLVQLSLKVLREVYNPDGFNIGVNIGKVAGAGIESHVHIHIVPRWSGDTNFMPVFGNVKVIPEALEDTYEKIKKVIDEKMMKPSNTEMR